MSERTRPLRCGRGRDEEAKVDAPEDAKEARCRAEVRKEEDKVEEEEEVCAGVIEVRGRRGGGSEEGPRLSLEREGRATNFVST